MEELLAQITPFLILFPLVFIAGLVDAIGGGGGLISLPAYLLAGFPMHSALGMNKMSSMMGTALATFRYAKAGYIDFKTALPCAFFGIIGSVTGANIAMMIPDNIFRIIMVIVIPLTALYLMRTHSLDLEAEKFSRKKTLLLCVVIGLGIGVYDGVYGPGTGTFLILAFTGIAHLSLVEANGITKVVNLTTNISAFTVFLLNGQIIIWIGFCAGLFNMAGAWVGTNLFTQKGSNITRPIMFVVLAIFMVKTVSELITG